MSKLHGKEAKIFNNGVVIVSLRDLTVDVKDKRADATDHDSGGWEESIGGNKSWTVKATHCYVLNDTSQNALYDALVGGTLLPIVIYNDGQGSGKPQFAGNAAVDDFSPKAPNTDLQTIDISLTGTGPLTRSVQP